MSAGEFTKVPILNKESIIVGSNLIRDFLPKDLRAATPKTTKYVVITDTAVHKLHFGLLLQALNDAGVSSDRTVPVGEHTKSREQKASIEDWMLANECNRDTCIIALGGGVVGDLSGFVAATYLRGIPFIQIPTTLLAMVDSSIGGKTGINTSKAKNLIGAIYQPVRIYIDITFLQTLPKRQIANGMAEVIKTFAIRNEEMFGVLEESYDKVFDPVGHQDTLHKIIVECVKIKAEVVTIDETETGLRTLLNFGHTVGHAIESVCMDFMLHGECVAIGMVKEAEIARELGHLAPSAVARLASCIRAYSLPISIPSEGSATEVLMGKMALDKKNVGGKKRCVLLTKIGATLNDVAQLVDDEVLLRSVSKPIIVIPPSSPIQGSIRVPGSKSISNRVLLLAAMGEGECRVGGLLHSDDTQVMMNALKLLGAAEFRYEKSSNPHDTEPVLVVKGNGGKMTAPSSGKHLYLGNAGTATRFLATLCTLVGVYSSPGSKELQKVVLTGDKRMCERPIKDLVIALKQHQDCVIRYLGTDGCPPLEIDGTGLRGGKIELAADVSSQFVSSILLSSPYANTPVTLSLDPHKEVVSQPYIDMTVSLMRDFGVNVEVSADKRTYTIPKQPYKNPPSIEVESDASSSTYPLVFAAITGGKVTALNVTSKSLQGDAQFCKVLEKMGCTVHQDEHKTTVEGPKEGQLRGVDYNMGDLTDAFMGVACLAAVANGTTRITGIANQRVKECNRIQVMVEELTKLGVKCKELEDGVEVEGLPLSAFKPGAINCYNDHRIAMSFACLGCKVPNITIKDKECVQKTYPEFWDDLHNVFGVKLTTPKIEPKTAESEAQTGKPQRVIIIGMRGAGKTSQGRVAAGALGYPFVDIDEYFESKIEPHNIKAFIEQKGWEQFRVQELNSFHEVLSEHKDKSIVVSCGGGIVETEPARKALFDLAKLPNTHIIFFQRHIDDIVDYLLEKDKVRPAFTEHPSAVYARRFENYRRCSTHEFVINKGDEDWHAIEREFIDFVSQITGQATHKFVQASARNVEHDLGSFFICLTFPDYTDAQKVSKKDIEVLSEGVHAIEFRADLLSSKDGLNPEILGKQHAALRRKNTHRLPLIFTIRTVSHGGSFSGNEDSLFSFLEQGVRYGVEYLDVESTWSKSSLSKIVTLKERNPSTFKIISSYHCYYPKIWEDDGKITAMFDLCYFSKSVDVVKVVVNATEAHTHGTRIHRLAEQWRDSHPGVPTIVLCTSEKGKIARVLNRFLTPVTHPLLPAKAAPGQMSVQEIHLARHSLGYIPKGNFYLFGSPISQSRSPLIHNTGFKILGLPHEYQLFETLDINEISKNIRDPATFGASVTIPHKLDVIPLVDKLSEHAKKIGAVNTIYKVPTKEGTWEVWGDNTDFLGVKGLLTARLGKDKPLTALVLGAGGTSRAVLYALNRMNVEGFKVTKYIYNRSTDKAKELAAEFDSHVIASLTTPPPTLHPDLVISTLPPAAQTEIFESEGTDKEAEKFGWMFNKGALAMDLVYRPRETPVLRLAKRNGVRYLIEGIEILLEQGFAQFCIWTGTKAAPTNEIREVVMASL